MGFRDDLYKTIVEKYGPVPRVVFDEVVSECSKKRLERAIEELIVGAPIRQLFSDIEGAFPGATLVDVLPRAGAPTSGGVDTDGTNTLKPTDGRHKSKGTWRRKGKV